MANSMTAATVPQGEAEETMRDYLSACDQVSRSMPGRDNMQHRSFESLLLAHGIWFQPQRLPSGYRRMAIKQCYTNAYHLALNDPELIYVEGYAMCVIPVLHAWVVKVGSHKVIDPTWESIGGGAAYLGIPFQLKYLNRVMARSGCAIDNYKDRFPIISGKHTIDRYWHPGFPRKTHETGCIGAPAV